MKPILLYLIMIGLLQSLHAATLVTQSFANNTVGTMLHEDMTTLTATPNFSTAEVNGATQLEVVFTIVGDAHMFIQSTTSLGRQHAAELLTEVVFGHVNTTSALFLNVSSGQLTSLDESPNIPGNGSADTSSIYAANPMSYSITRTFTDLSQISSINGSSLDFGAEVLHTLGTDAQFNELFDGADYSNYRLQDVSYTIDFNLSTVPEPSSCLLLSGSLLLFLLRRRR